jgi:hypothetical protein
MPSTAREGWEGSRLLPEVLYRAFLWHFPAKAKNPPHPPQEQKATQETRAKIPTMRGALSRLVPWVQALLLLSALWSALGHEESRRAPHHRLDSAVGLAVLVATKDADHSTV